MRRLFFMILILTIIIFFTEHPPGIGLEQSICIAPGFVFFKWIKGKGHQQ